MLPEVAQEQQSYEVKKKDFYMFLMGDVFKLSLNA